MFGDKLSQLRVIHDSKGDQESTLGGAVQMFSANSPYWLNNVNNSHALTGQYTGELAVANQ